MADSLAGVVLAAGAGVRLRPLTLLRPKALCPVGTDPLVDHALARFAGTTGDVAVNVHHGRELLESHLAGRVHLSFEEERPLGTAGAIGRLREWIAGRAVLIANADSWCAAPMGALLEGWDGQRPRVLTVAGGEFGRGMIVAGALLSWRDSSRLDAEPAGLYETVWRTAAAEHRLDVVQLDPAFDCVDCGTASDYLRANLTWSGGASVVGAGAVVEGTVERSVVWPGAVVLPTEHLVRAIRAHDRLTVLVR